MPPLIAGLRLVSPLRARPRALVLLLPCLVASSWGAPQLRPRLPRQPTAAKPRSRSKVQAADEMDGLATQLEYLGLGEETPRDPLLASFDLAGVADAISSGYNPQLCLTLPGRPLMCSPWKIVRDGSR